MADEQEKTTGHKHARANRRAVLFVRGWTGPRPMPGEEPWAPGFPQPFVELVCRELQIGRSDVVKLERKFDLGLMSTARPDDLVEQLLTAVDQHYAEKGFEELVIVAFSAGTVLARNLYATAYGAVSEPDAELPRHPAHEWAPRITRIILLAGVTRGWELSSATPPMLRFIARPVMSLANLYLRFACAKELFIQQIRRGAPFVIESRLKLLQVELASRKVGGPELAHTVLLLGSKDEFVSPADAMDLGPKDDCSYIEVPASSHMSIFDVAGASKDPSSEAGMRAEYIRHALHDDPKTLDEVHIHGRPIRMRAEDIDAYADPMDRGMQAFNGDGSLKHRNGTHRDCAEGVDHVVFVMHGIRDNGFWTKRVARALKDTGRDIDQCIRTPCPSYGYFSIWDFINPWGREEATYWFLERYAEAKRLWPGAKVSFIGHSNGTFIAAQALKICPMVHLERIAFAGSVVRTDYFWANETRDQNPARMPKRGRVNDQVLNIVATHDLVVTFLPGALQRLRLFPVGVGGAGSAGFDFIPSGPAGPRVHNFRYLSGSHGAGVDEPIWTDLARFIIHGTLPEQTPDQARPRERRGWQKALMFLAPWATLGLFIGGVWVIQLLVAIPMSAGQLALLSALTAILIVSIVRHY